MPGTKRREARVKAALPVQLDGRAAGVTKDVSASGVFFETEEEMTDGSAIEFTVEFDSPTGKLVMRCSGRIMRVERSGTGTIGVAARILESKLELKQECIGTKAGAARQDGSMKAMAVAR